MSNIELVIKIPEEIYRSIKEIPASSMFSIDCDSRIRKAITNGTQCPKEHGRLIDADELEELFGEMCVGDCGACMTKRKTDGRGRWYDTCPLIDISPTIIEADKESEE